MADLNFAEDLAIDLDNLHLEWQSHSAIRYNYACEISHLDQKVKKADEKVKVTRSRLIKEASSDPEKCCGVKKATAPLIEAYYRTHQDHENAKDDLIQAQYDLSMAYNAVKAFDDRKLALQDEVKLYLNNYYSTPSEQREVKEGKLIIDTNREKSQTSQRSSLNKDKSDKPEKPKKTEEKPKTTRRRKR